MNLCINARDAMPNGGRLTLGTELLEVDSVRVEPHPGVRPGRFVCLTVADSGCGMDPDTIARIFEPFFTTKEVGKGTGLGLATVHGVVTQHQGWAEVDSVPGQGTVFRLFFPAAESPAPVAPAAAKSKPRGGTESILVVEDDQQVRQLVRNTLRFFGYDILEAATGAEALRVWDLHGTRVHLLFTDMVMPGGLSGLELAEQLRKSRPGLKVIVSSGYSAELLERTGQVPEGIHFLPKPYDPETLVRVVRDCLDQEG
jgi:CheY-like chemotaxis protein